MLIQYLKTKLGVVVHTGNPRYPASRGRGLRPAQGLAHAVHLSHIPSPKMIVFKILVAMWNLGNITEYFCILLS
jgi:hypothetical protein